jgi:hypothetical protein
MLGNPFTEGAMRIGFCLCEIVSDLKQHSHGQQHLTRINDVYRDFRQSDTAELARKTAEQLCQELEEAAHTCPDLTAKSADLQSRIHEVVRALE